MPAPRVLLGRVARTGFVWLMVVSCSPEVATPPRNLIVMIADGAGVGHWSLAAMSREALAVSQFPVAGLVDTRGAGHRVTDSAAGATALSTGVRTVPDAVGVGPDGQPLETVLEAAMAAGKATGLVTTTSIVDATPAAFAAHVTRRSAFDQIKRQMLDQRINVLMGGGRRVFERTADGQVIDVAHSPDYVYAGSAAELDGLSLDTVTHVLGLFAAGDMPRAGDRSPSLPRMTSAALTVLDRDPDGFFLMVENEGSDTEAHRNSPADLLVAEMLEFDAAVRDALAFQEAHPETLLIVTADHETGGITLPADPIVLERTRASMLDSIILARGGSRAATAADSAALPAFVRADSDRLARFLEAATTPGLRYETDNHTAALVPLFAIGPGAERFGGLNDNRQIGQLLLELVRN